MLRGSPRRRLAWTSAFSIGAASAIALVAVLTRPGIDVGPRSLGGRSDNDSRGGETAASAFLEQGDDSLGAKRLRAAEASYRRALELDPMLAAARWKLISIYTLQMRRTDLPPSSRRWYCVMPFTSAPGWPAGIGCALP